MEYLLGALATLAALAFVAYPLFRRGAPAMSAVEAPETFAERRAAVYRELLELEFDHRVGKLSDADFRELSEAALERAASVLAEADASQAATDEHLEREIASVRESLNRARGRAVAERERS